jgi:phosphohistidine phosphatase
MRHGIAVDLADGSWQVDAERALTPQGIVRTRAAARGLARLLPCPDRVLASPLKRAEQTAQLAAEALGFPAKQIETCPALEPDAAPLAVLETLARQPAASALCVGHLPHLDLLLAALLTGTRVRVGSFKKASAACLELNFPSKTTWTANLEWFIPPRALRAIGRAHLEKPVEEE